MTIGVVRPRQAFAMLALTLALGLATGTKLIAGENQDENQEPFRKTFVAFAVVGGNIATGRAGTVTMTITRWTTDAERQQLASILVEEGSSELTDALNDQEETGFIRVPRSPSYRLRYAREFRQGGQRRIILATDRPIGFREARNNPRLSDYSISIIELVVDEEGDGEGVIIVGAELDFNAETRTIEIEGYASAPVRLLQVRRDD